LSNATLDSLNQLVLDVAAPRHDRTADHAECGLGQIATDSRAELSGERIESLPQGSLTHTSRERQSESVLEDFGGIIPQQMRRAQRCGYYGGRTRSPFFHTILLATLLAII
jgi:hypothetical protein